MSNVPEIHHREKVADLHAELGKEIEKAWDDKKALFEIIDRSVGMHRQMELGYKMARARTYEFFIAKCRSRIDELDHNEFMTIESLGVF